MENNKNHILIVDDDDRIRNLLKDYLSENNYVVSTAESADQAKDRLKYIKFDSGKTTALNVSVIILETNVDPDLES